MSTLNEKIYKDLENNSCYVKDSDCSIDFEATHETVNEIKKTILQEIINLLNECNADNVNCGEDVAYNVQNKISELTNQLKALT